MDWTLAIDKNREALKGILAMLVAMIAMGGNGQRQVASIAPAGTVPRNPAMAESNPSSALTLPRHLHRFVLRLLRPAEAAARRLIIVAARGLVVELAPLRPRKPRHKPLCNRRNGFGTGIVIRPGPLPEWVRKLAPKRSAALSLPLLDPLKRFGVRRRYVKQADVPRIRSFDDPRPVFFHQPRPPAPPQPSPDDPLDASRLHRRVEAIGRVLEDLPGQAKRLARWQARRDAALAYERDAAPTGDRTIAQGFSPTPNPTPQGGGGLGLVPLDAHRERPAEAWRPVEFPSPLWGGVRGGGIEGHNPGHIPLRHRETAAAPSTRTLRLSPMRPGRPPGWRRRPDHKVDEVLTELHGLAVWARERPDTS